jgi:hypothetical protein
MSKKIISICFSVIFLLFLVAPTILEIVDDSFDTSILFSDIDKEKEHEKQLEIEIYLSKVKFKNSYFIFITIENNLLYFYKKYAKPELNIISPPPELSLA